jgi:hypothetical protein
VSQTCTDPVLEAWRQQASRMDSEFRILTAHLSRERMTQDVRESVIPSPARPILPAGSIRHAAVRSVPPSRADGRLNTWHERSSAPLEWRGDEPPLKLDRPWLRRQEIPMDLLSRHVMVTGETGSGKTRSGIEPLLGPLLRYRLQSADGGTKTFAMLVFDGKGEFSAMPSQPFLEAEREGRLVRIGGPQDKSRKRIRFFEGLEDLSVADRLLKIDQIAPDAWRSPSGNSASWVEQARAVLRGFANAEALCRRAQRPLLARVLAHLGVPAGAAGDSFFRQLQTLMGCVCQDWKQLKELHGYLTAQGAEAGVGQAEFGFLAMYVGTENLIEQFNYMLMSLTILLSAINRPDVTALVDFDLFASENGPGHLSVYDMIGRGDVIMFSPSTLAQDSITLVGRALKTLFFQAVFTRQDKERPVAYVCDEFHRFVTCDAESGEQNLLDRCRAYRCVCILGTQSVESIRYALSGQTSPEAAIGVMLNNIACKLFLRNSDPRTAGLLQTLLPRPPDGGPHIVEVRPLTTLRPGEVYYLHADGRWGRSQVVLG